MRIEINNMYCIIHVIGIKKECQGKDALNMNAKSNTNPLQEMDKLPVSRAVLKNVLPAVAAMLMALIYNMADKVFIGMAGNDLMVTAITMATPVFVLFTSFGNIFGTGGVSLISRLIGEGNTKKSDKVSSFCFWGSIGIGIVVMLVLLFGMNPIVSALGAIEAETIQYTKDYLYMVAICCPFSVLSTAMSSLVRAEGKPTLSMTGMILGNVVNIILDPVFILGFGMGPRGAGLATLIGQVCSVAFYIICILKGKSNLSVRVSDFTLEKSISCTVFAIGTPAALSMIFQSLCNFLINNHMSKYGDIAVAGMGAAQNIVTIVGIFAVGIGTGIQPLLGYQIGNGNKKRFFATLRYSLTLTLGISIVITALCYLFTGSIIGAFVTGTEAVTYGVDFARIILTTLWVYCLFTVCGLVLQAMGRATASLVVNMSRNGYVFIPILFIMSAGFGMKGIIWAYPVSDLISIVITVLILIPAVRKCFDEELGNTNVTEAADNFQSVGENGDKLNNDYVITIGRSYGAGGRTVGKLIAEKLGIPFYDKEIMEETAQKTGLSKRYLSKLDEHASMTNAPGIYNSIYTSDKQVPSVESIAYHAQKEVIEKIAEKGSCVIVGRRADQILKDKYPTFSIFVSAPLEERVCRVSKREKISEKEAEQKIGRIDKERAAYYRGAEGQKWGDAENYNLCIDNNFFDVEKTVEIIVSAIQSKKDKE